MIGSHCRVDWKVDRYDSDGTLTDRSASAFISVYNIQTSRYHHFLFKGLMSYKLLLYATGIPRSRHTGYGFDENQLGYRGNRSV